VHNNAVCTTAADFDAKSLKIRRSALPADDIDAANKSGTYSRVFKIQNSRLKGRLNKIERKIAALQNNVQIMLHKIEKIREMHHVK